MLAEMIREATGAFEATGLHLIDKPKIEVYSDHSGAPDRVVDA